MNLPIKCKFDQICSDEEKPELFPISADQTEASAHLFFPCTRVIVGPVCSTVPHFSELYGIIF